MSLSGSVEPSLFPWLLGNPNPDVELEEFFTPAFMQEFTRFASFEAFMGESPWSIEARDDLDHVPTEELDRYVRRVTVFDSWEGMRNRAAEREILSELLI